MAGNRLIIGEPVGGVLFTDGHGFLQVVDGEPVVAGENRRLHGVKDNNAAIGRLSERVSRIDHGDGRWVFLSADRCSP